MESKLKGLSEDGTEFVSVRFNTWQYSYSDKKSVFASLVFEIMDQISEKAGDEFKDQSQGIITSIKSAISLVEVFCEGVSSAPLLPRSIR